MPAALKRLRVPSWAEFARAVKAGATAGKVAGTVVTRTERRTRTGGRMGIVGLSDPSGHYEAVIFAEGLQQYRDLLEPGSGGPPVPHAPNCRARRCARASSRSSRSIRRRRSSPRACASSCAPRRRSTAWRAASSPRATARSASSCMLAGGTEVGGAAARPLQGLAADRRRHQGGAGRGDGRGGVTADTHPVGSGSILPGFMMLFGSSARLIADMAARAGTPCSAARNCIFPDRPRARRCTCHPWPAPVPQAVPSRSGARAISPASVMSMSR